MEYTDVEKQVLSLMERTGFKNLSKNDVINCASKLSELRPEVATQVIAQFPELAKLIQSSMVSHKDILEKIVLSDNESTSEVYGILNKEIQTSDESRKEYFKFSDKILSDFSKSLENPALTPEQQNEILQNEMELLRMIHKKDSEIREQEIEAVRIADKKDTEKKEFNWKVVGAASFVFLAAVGIGTTALGGDFNIKLPKPKH